MVVIFRVVFLLVFALFWGGLTFYTGIVVRVMHDVLPDPMDGGMITQRVTDFLQFLSVALLVLMLVNCAVVSKKSKKHAAVLVSLTALFACSVAGIFFVHGQLDSVIDLPSSSIIDRQAFTIAHRRYNQLTTIQWISSLTYLPSAMLAWRCVDKPPKEE